MLILGVLIGVGAALVFLTVGLLTLLGGADATRRQILPGFAPDRPGPLARLLTFLGVWGPIALVALLSILAGLQIIAVVARAI
ncbi:MAG TPA: hypothetical protein VFS21_19635 [Roseiflexaceae bacterium]|nr:hypothetical protein [Roseiflexaceae bacterium]